MRSLITNLAFATGIILLATQLVVGLTLLAVVGVADFALDKLEDRNTNHPRS